MLKASSYNKTQGKEWDFFTKSTGKLWSPGLKIMGKNIFFFRKNNKVLLQPHSLLTLWNYCCLWRRPCTKQVLSKELLDKRTWNTGIISENTKLQVIAHTDTRTDTHTHIHRQTHTATFLQVWWHLCLSATLSCGCGCCSTPGTGSVSIPPSCPAQSLPSAASSLTWPLQELPHVPLCHPLQRADAGRHRGLGEQLVVLMAWATTAKPAKPHHSKLTIHTFSCSSWNLRITKLLL